MIVSLGKHPEMNDNLDRLQAVYEGLGVTVRRYESRTTDAVFHRDVFAWTPWGLIQCRMGKRARAAEPEQWFRDAGLAPALVLEEPDTFEGADLLWLSRSEAVVAVGRRTNPEGAARVIGWLAEHGVAVRQVSLPRWHEQHLLGVANCIDGRLFSFAAVLDQTDLRHQEEALPAQRHAVALPDQEYPIKGTNWVVVGRHAVINQDCTESIRILEQYVEVVPVPINQLLAHGGGVACATGMIQP